MHVLNDVIKSQSEIFCAISAFFICFVEKDKNFLWISIVFFLHTQMEGGNIPEQLIDERTVDMQNA